MSCRVFRSQRYQQFPEAGGDYLPKCSSKPCEIQSRGGCLSYLYLFSCITGMRGGWGRGRRNFIIKMSGFQNVMVMLSISVNRSVHISSETFEPFKLILKGFNGSVLINRSRARHALKHFMNDAISNVPQFLFKYFEFLNSGVMFMKFRCSSMKHEPWLFSKTKAGVTPRNYNFSRSHDQSITRRGVNTINRK